VTQFQCTSEELGDDVLVLTLTGELDLSTIKVVETTLREAENRKAGSSGSNGVVVLDLRELEFLDSSGLRFILAEHSRARERNGRLVIVSAKSRVQRVFRITGTESRLEFVHDPAEVTRSTRPEAPGP
jgi:anti-anti-sigma factor